MVSLIPIIVFSILIKLVPPADHCFIGLLSDIRVDRQKFMSNENVSMHYDGALYVVI